jgi:hypothetical protein
MENDVKNNVDLLHFLKVLQSNADNHQEEAQITPDEKQLSILAALNNKKELNRANPNVDFLLKLNKDFNRIFSFFFSPS